MQGFGHSPQTGVDAVHSPISTTQSQKLWSPPPPKYKVMYSVDASVRSVKFFSPVHKIVLTGPWPECTAL
jgi:hypothetical protein